MLLFYNNSIPWPACRCANLVVDQAGLLSGSIPGFHLAHLGIDLRAMDNLDVPAGCARRREIIRLGLAGPCHPGRSRYLCRRRVWKPQSHPGIHWLINRSPIQNAVFHRKAKKGTFDFDLRLILMLNQNHICKRITKIILELHQIN